jgi:hypothetical protein
MYLTFSTTTRILSTSTLALPSIHLETDLIPPAEELDGHLWIPMIRPISSASPVFFRADHLYGVVPCVGHAFHRDAAFSGLMELQWSRGGSVARSYSDLGRKESLFLFMGVTGESRY